MHKMIYKLFTAIFIALTVFSCLFPTKDVNAQLQTGDLRCGVILLPRCSNLVSVVL
jgi:hypothetical protein